MNLTNSLSVVHVTSAHEEKPAELRDSIRELLRSGSDVVVICHRGTCRRAARMALATSMQRNEFPGRRFAVVTPNVREFVDTLPTSVVQHLTVFENEDQAIDWLGLGDPCDSDRSTVVWPMAV